MPKQYEFGDPQREELAWAAGFFDGEGTTAAVAMGKCGRQIVAAVSQAGEHAPILLERFRSAVGLGKVYLTKRTNVPKHWKAMYAWRTGKFADVKRVLELLWPWLGPAKRQQAARAFELYASRPPRRPMTTERGKQMANQRWNHAQTIHQN